MQRARPQRFTKGSLLPFLLCLLSLREVQATNLGVGAPGFSANINFQPRPAATPPGYVADCGDTVGQRGGGLNYGWDTPNSKNAFERNLSPDKLLDTGLKMQGSSGSASWSIKVPNGLYDVVVGAGDPAVTKGHPGTRYEITVEGVPVITQATPDKAHWCFGADTHVQIWVRDGKLTLTTGPGARNASVCFVRIQQVAPIMWGAAIIDNANRHKCPVDYVSESEPGVLGYYEGHTRKRISLIHWGKSWGSGLLSSETNYMNRMWARGTIPVYSWSPSGPVKEDYSLGNIIAGKHDAFLTNWFKVAKAYGKPFFLNFAREMNGTWYTWSEGHAVNAGSPPGLFTNMWRHVRDICTGVGCTNITWVWVADRDIRNEKHIQPLSRFYPGDDYVDWVGIDLYNAGAIPPYKGEPFTTVYGTTYSNVVKIAPNKPIMICETGTKNLSATPKPVWITQALTELPSAFPNIRAFVWFNWNDGQTNKNWPIQGGGNTLPYTTAPVDWDSVRAFSRGIASPFFLGSIFTNQAHIAASPIRPALLLPAPEKVFAAVRDARVDLRWSPVTGADSYSVYRSISGKENDFALVGTTAGTTFTDAPIVNDGTCRYVVTASNLAGESVESEVIAAIPTAVPETAKR